MTDTSASPAGSNGAQTKSGGAGRFVLWLLILAILGGGGYYLYQRYYAQKAPATAPAKKEGLPAKGAGKGFAGPTPVVAVPARRGNINVFLDGLGTVTPLRTVTVRSRVDGQLMRVHFQEGQFVKAGQLLAEIDARPFEVQLQQAQGQLARDQALLANARLDLERYRTLLEQDSIAKQQVDSQEALVRQYEGVVKADQSQVDNARLQLTYARVTAPISGRVGLRLVDPGNIVRAGDASGLVVITQLDPISVLFTVPQDHLPALMRRTKSGDKLPVEAWDREQRNKLADGHLVAVDNLVDTATGTVRLKAEFDNTKGDLFPNQFVNVRLKLDTLENQVVTSPAAIQRGGRGLFVYVVRDDMTVTARPVEIGVTDGPRVAVLKGLRPGEQVVIDGIDRLREGARVELTKRPEFKPTIDGTSGARKGKGKGKGKKPPAEGAAPGAAGDKPPAAGTEPAGAPAAPSEVTPGAAPAATDGEPPRKKGRKRPPEDAPADSPGAAGGSAPLK